MNKRNFLAAGASLTALVVLTGGCTTTGTAQGDPASQRQAIDSGADAALSRLYAQQPGSRELVSKAAGVLVFPSFTSAGFIVGGGTGRGVLRAGGKSVRYYSMTEASVGLLAGAQSQAVFILFMTPQALDAFQKSNGWTVGTDASVSMLTVGANAAINTATANQSVIGFVMTNSGLMGNVSLNGNRVTPLNI